METSLRVLGEEHSDTLTNMANLAATYQCQGRHLEARRLIRSADDLRKRAFRKDYPDTIDSGALLEQ